MRDEYDFSMARRSPYGEKLTESITVRLDEQSVAYFTSMSEELAISRQRLISLYLRDCARSRRKLEFHWKRDAKD